MLDSCFGNVYVLFLQHRSPNSDGAYSTTTTTRTMRTGAGSKYLIRIKEKLKPPRIK